MKNFKNQTTYNRAKHDDSNKYTLIAFETVRDKRLTSNELGILVYILSHANDFVINKGMIQRWSRLGDHSFNKCWNDLKQYGYIEKKPIQSGVEWTINEKVSTTPENRPSTIPIFSTPENSTPENSGSEIGYLSNIDNKEILSKESNIEDKETSYTPDFRINENEVKTSTSQIDSTNIDTTNFTGLSDDQLIEVKDKTIQEFSSMIKDEDQLKLSNLTSTDLITILNTQGYLQSQYLIDFRRYFEGGIKRYSKQNNINKQPQLV